MAQLTFLHYVHKNTVIHQMDPRIKLLCLFFLSLSVSLASEWKHYVSLFLLIAIVFMASKLPMRALLKDMKFLILLMLFVFVSHMFTIKGDPILNFPMGDISIQGIMSGLRFVGRLTMILMLAIIMTSTTTIWKYKNAVEWYLRPLPFVSECQISTMISLTFVLIPVILDRYQEMMEAQKARGIELTKNPIKRLKFIIFPFLSRTLQSTDEIIYAMTSRCYSQMRTKVLLKANQADFLMLFICFVHFVFIIM